MTTPCICNHCGNTFDLSKAKKINRYFDCSEFETPCCHNIVDDRPGIFKKLYRHFFDTNSSV